MTDLELFITGLVVEASDPEQTWRNRRDARWIWWCAVYHRPNWRRWEWA